MGLGPLVCPSRLLTKERSTKYTTSSCISWIILVAAVSRWNPMSGPCRSCSTYFTERLVKLTRRSAAIFTENFDDLGRGRMTARAAGRRFSLKAARRFHHEDSKSIGDGTVVGLDIDHHQSSIVIAVRVPVIAVGRPHAISVGVAIVVGQHTSICWNSSAVGILRNVGVGFDNSLTLTIAVVSVGCGISVFGSAAAR